MNPTRIKICGVMRVEDAHAAARAGADAVGMVFYRAAKRAISFDRAREILAVLPPFVTPVGLFVDSSPQEVREVARSLGLRHVQLHGREDADCIAKLEQFVVLKAVRVDRNTFQRELDGWRSAVRRNLPNLKGLILESPAGGVPGGTGVENDWATVLHAKMQGEFEGLPSIIAAGGLTPENVANVVRTVAPWAVDVSSGVEERFGEKSSQKIERFIAAVRSVGQ